MPQKRKSMKTIRKIFQLRLADSSMSIRTIAQATRVSRPVVKQYLDLLSKHPLDTATLNSMNDESLQKYLEIKTTSYKESEEQKQLKLWLSNNIHRLSQQHVTRLLLHEQYLEQHPGGLQYTQFCFVIKQQYQSAEVSTVLEHKAGDKMYIDYTGQKLHWTDTLGKDYCEEIYLSVLGASSYVFSIPVQSQKMHDFCYATEQAFLYFGGVPKAVVPDCLKSAVLSHDGHESVINPLFQRLTEHYGTVCIPARPRHPKDKPQVEGSVNLIYHQILARMKGLRFDTRDQMLSWWFKALEKINEKPFQKMNGSRLQRFNDIDKPALKSLPSERFDLTAVLHQKVPTTGVIYVPEDRTNYSVPSSLVHKFVEILVKPDEVHIWYEGEQKAVHKRVKNAGNVICPAHRSPAHSYYADRNLQELVRELKERGTHIGTFSQTIVDTKEHEDLSWQLLCGVRSLYKMYPNRLDAVCRIAIKHNEFTIKALKLIIKKEEDIALVATERLTPELPFHENIRGAQYYQNNGESA